VSRITIDDLLARARRRLDRVTTDDVVEAVRDGAVVVDIRSEVQRARDGLIPEAIVHPRNVLEWRCDPSSGRDDPRLSGDLGRRIVLVCHEGYQSSLAAANLQAGIRARDRPRGGFQAWAAAGLPLSTRPRTGRPRVDQGPGEAVSARSALMVRPDGATAYHLAPNWSRPWPLTSPGWASPA
jgi:rhodanese-related sulfurtransferase